MVHPQKWPEDLDYAGKRVVVIGSGATAVTMVPAMAETAAHVTMLQRSPTYIVTLPAVDPIAQRAAPGAAAEGRLRGVAVEERAAPDGHLQPQPLAAEAGPRKLIRAGVRHQLPDGYDVDRHFRPPYDPWDERMCVVPDADLFKSISSGRAEMVTDTIDEFTESGIRLDLRAASWRPTSWSPPPA